MAEIAELVAPPKTLEATLSYFVDTETMPVTVVGAPGGSDRRIGDCQRPGLDRMADRSPYLDDGEAAVKQLVGLVR